MNMLILGLGFLGRPLAAMSTALTIAFLNGKVFATSVCVVDSSKRMDNGPSPSSPSIDCRCKALPNQQTVYYPSFKLVIVGDDGTVREKTTNKTHICLWHPTHLMAIPENNVFAQQSLTELDSMSKQVGLLSKVKVNYPDFKHKHTGVGL